MIYSYMRQNKTKRFVSVLEHFEETLNGCSLDHLLGASVAEIDYQNADIILNDAPTGIGFVLSLPEPSTKFAIEEGYLLWIGLYSQPIVQLIR